MSKLFVVGTPIGNLEDITLRAIRILKEVEYIACEDKRTSSKLLNHFQIKNAKLISYNLFNEKNSSLGIIKLLKENKRVALISDAGMPLISDPGYNIINDCKKNNIEIEIIPGVSAITTAFVLSGLSNTFNFKGFINHSKESLKQELKKTQEGTYIYFVSPHKLISSLESIEEILENESEIFLAKELTKINEETFKGKPSEILLSLKNKEKIKGEYTLIIKIFKKQKIKINKYSKNK